MINLYQASLHQALDTIQARSGVQVSFLRAEIDRVATTVTLANSHITVRHAIDTVLTGTSLRASVTSTGQVVIARDAAPTVLIAPQPNQASGTIHGRVMDALTSHPLHFATVVLDGTRTTTTSDSGRYRFENVSQSQHSVSVRALGYSPMMQSIAIGGGNDITIDLALTKSASQLDQVVVTGTVVPTEVRALPTPITIISAADLEAQQPPLLTDALRQAVPSAIAWSTPNSPNITTMSVRGASTLSPGATALKVYLDGIELSDFGAAAIDPSSIDHIEVLRGPEASTIYGANALGGVMEVFSKHGDPTRVNPQVNLQVALGRIQSPYTNYSGALRQDYKASILGGSSAASYGLGASYTQNGAWVREGQSTIPSGYGGLHIDQGPVGIDVSARYFAQKMPSGLNPALASAASYFAVPFYQQTLAQEQTYGAHVTYRPLSWWQNTLTVGGDQYAADTHQTQPRLTSEADSELTVSQVSERKFTLAYNSSVELHPTTAVSTVVTVGLDGYSYQTGGYYTTGAFGVTGTIPTDPAVPAQATRDIENDVGYFGQTQIGFSDVLFLTAGVRVEHNTSFGSDIGTPVSPRFGVAYVLPVQVATIKLRGSYGQAIRPPSPYERRASVSGPSVQLANDHLLPERQRGWDAGAEVFVGTRLSLSATYYDQIATNLINGGPIDSTGLVSQYQNVGRAHNTGVELEGTVSLGIVSFHAQYASTKSRVEALGAAYTGDLRVGDQVYYIPQHTAGASLSFSPFRTTHLTAGVSYVGAWTGYNNIAEIGCAFGTGPCAPSTRDYFRGYPGFTKVNLTVGQDVTSVLSGFVTVSNLLNTDALEFQDTQPVQGRVTMVGVRVHL